MTPPTNHKRQRTDTSSAAEASAAEVYSDNDSQIRDHDFTPFEEASGEQRCLQSPCAHFARLFALRLLLAVLRQSFLSP